jgi:hypothetical protein
LWALAQSPTMAQLSSARLQVSHQLAVSDDASSQTCKG